MRQLHDIVATIVLLLLNFHFGSSQVVESSYRKQSMEGKRLIIAPLLSVDSVDTSFAIEFPDIQNPRDSLARLLEEELQFRMRKHSQFRSLYCSTYKKAPSFSRRTLLSSRGDTLQVFMPADGDTIQMDLKGRNPVEPDFVLFLQVGSIIYVKPSFMEFLLTTSLRSFVAAKTGIDLPITSMEGIFLKDVIYVFWDNKAGRIAAHEQRSLFFEDSPDEVFRKESPFAADSKYVDLVARYILTRTPFADPDMVYYLGF